MRKFDHSPECMNASRIWFKKCTTTEYQKVSSSEPPRVRLCDQDRLCDSHISVCFRTPPSTGFSVTPESMLVRELPAYSCQRLDGEWVASRCSTAVAFKFKSQQPDAFVVRDSKVDWYALMQPRRSGENFHSPSCDRCVASRTYPASTPSRNG